MIIGTPDEIFGTPLHPYTRSLLSAIPRMNPIMPSDGNAVYDMREAGIDYALGTWHDITATHRVFCTDEEFELWQKKE